MSVPQQSASQSFWVILRNLISSPLFNGIVAFVGLIAAVRSEDPWIRVLAILIALGFALHFLHLASPTLRNVVSSLTWKFFVGFISGAVVGAIAVPLIFQPMLYSLLPLLAPKVEFVDSFPATGGALIEVYSGVVLRFAGPIPPLYRNLMKVEIAPPHPIRIEWSSDNQTLYVSPTKIYPAQESHTLNPRFEYDTTYYLTVSGPTLKEPLTVEFHTPKR